MVRPTICLLVFLIPLVFSINHHHGCPEYHECTQSLKNLTKEQWEYRKELQEAFYDASTSINGRILQMANIIALHRETVPVNDTSIPDAYSMFRMYTVTDFDRSKEARVADLMEHWEIGDHDETEREKVELTIKRFVLDWDQMADYVKEGCGQDVMKIMQKVIRVAMQAEDFFHVARPRDVMKDLATCFTKHASRAMVGDE